MFKISKNNLLLPHFDLPIITNGFKVLLSDDEPVLFTGFNRYENRIIGSYLIGDKTKTRYIHAIIDNKEYLDFKYRKISLLELYQNKIDVFIIEKEKNFNYIYQMPLKNIPKNLLPSKEAFCPKYFSSPSFYYSSSLQGSDANNHEANPEELSKVQTKIADLLRTALNTILSSHSTKVSILAHGEGSFEIKYKIELEPNQNLLFPDIEKDKIKGIFDDYLAYPTIYLPQEVEYLHEEKNEKSYIHKLWERSSSHLGKSNTLRKIPKEKFIEKMIQFSRKYEEICDIEKKHFNKIQIQKEEPNDIKEPIALIDNEHGKQLLDSIAIYEKNSPKYQLDNEYLDYKITIYNLNIETRKGNAKLSDDKKSYKPRIKISGSKTLRNSKFSNSLHLEKEILVKAKATRYKKRVIFLEINE